MTPRERVNAAIAGQPVDRTPRDFAAVPEIWTVLENHFATTDREAILARLGIDCRTVSFDRYCRHPDGGGMQRPGPDGTSLDIWGAIRAPVANAVGVYEELCAFPLATAESVADIDRHPWPEASWWDFSALPDDIARLNRQQRHHIRWRIGSVFETAWSLRGFERFLLDLVEQPELATRILERVGAIHRANLERVLSLASDAIDMVYFYDDVASQQGPIIRPKLYEKLIAPHHRALVELARDAGKPTMIHCCGAVRPFIPIWLDLGIRVLNPVQTSAVGMEVDGLGRDFGGRLCFHGGVDVQNLLPTASPDEVRAAVAHLDRHLGPGWILAGSHHLQADIPLANILAMYPPVAGAVA